MEGAKLYRAQSDIDDFTVMIADLDHVAHMKRALKQDQDAGDDIPHQVLGAQSDSQSCGSGNGQQSIEGGVDYDEQRIGDS